MAKYRNYSELAEAFKSGELDVNYRIVLDKGGNDASLNYYNPKLSERENELKQAECINLFDPTYREHLDDLFVALGIPMEWA